MNSASQHAASFASPAHFPCKPLRSQSLPHSLSLPQTCSLCPASLQALFSRNICEKCRLPVCADHISRLGVQWECQKCARNRVKEAQDYQLERIAEVLRLRLFGLERERERLERENRRKEEENARFSREIRGKTGNCADFDPLASPSALQTTQLIDKLADFKAKYTDLVQQNTLLENQLVHLLQQEETIKATIAFKSHTNKSLSHRVIDQMRNLAQGVDIRKLKLVLCSQCCREITRKCDENRQGRRRNRSPEGKRCLFC